MKGLPIHELHFQTIISCRTRKKKNSCPAANPNESQWAHNAINAFSQCELHFWCHISYHLRMQSTKMRTIEKSQRIKIWSFGWKRRNTKRKKITRIRCCWLRCKTKIFSAIIIGWCWCRTKLEAQCRKKIMYRW